MPEELHTQWYNSKYEEYLKKETLISSLSISESSLNLKHAAYVGSLFYFLVKGSTVLKKLIYDIFWPRVQ